MLAWGGPAPRTDMPAFPAYVKVGWTDSAEAPRPVVERSEMERGVAKQRRVAADTVVTVPVTLYFDSAADADAFETWFYSAAGANGGAAWFDFTLPRSGTVVQTRVVGGDLGALKPSNRTWAMSKRQVRLEYVRAAL